MTLLRAEEVRKMNKKERDEKLKELKVALSKANVTANKANAKTKEIKRAIARVLTISHMQKREDKRAKSARVNESDKEALKLKK